MQGMALVLTLLVLSFCSAVGAALMLVTMPEGLASSSHRDSIAAFNAAETALEVAVRELARIADWNGVIAGVVQSSIVDGSAGVRSIPRRDDIDLHVLTNRLSCGSGADCTDAAIRLRTLNRPWGHNNPRWRLFLHGPLSAIVSLPEAAGIFVVVWVGDDGRENDGDPSVDGGGPGGEGLSIVRLRADSYGPGPSHRAVDAEVSRRKTMYVQRWNTVTSAVP